MLQKTGICALLVLALASPLSAQWDPDGISKSPFSPQFSVTTGVGQSVGWLGLQAEKYFRSGRLSVFGGMGYNPISDPGGHIGFTFAGGFRGFTPGTKHRGFLELSVSHIWSERTKVPLGSAYPGMWTWGTGSDDKMYGPGLQVGYQYISDAGLTFMTSVGKGYPIGQTDRSNGKRFGTLFGLGFGYTWR